MGVTGDSFCMTWKLSVFSLTRVQFHPPKVIPLTNLVEVTVQELCYCNSNAWVWYNGHQNIGITDQLIFQNEKRVRVYRRNNNGLKTI